MPRQVLGWTAIFMTIFIATYVALSRGPQSAFALLQADPAPREIDSLRDQIHSLQQTIQSQQSQLATFAASFKSQSDRIEQCNTLLTSLSDRGVNLDTTNKNFIPLKTDEGTLLIACNDCQPDQAGYRLTIKLGNPTTATFNGGVLHLAYGPAWKPSTDYAKWQQSLRSADFPFPQTLAPGVWTNVSILVTPATSDDLTYLKATLDLNSLSLRQRAQ
jgi:hypothetical protein